MLPRNHPDRIRIRIRIVFADHRLNQYPGGMCISGVLKMAERTPRNLASPSGPQLGSRRQCGLAICTFHLGFTLVLSHVWNQRVQRPGQGRLDNHSGVTLFQGYCDFTID